jgi:hypothetical protein
MARGSAGQPVSLRGFLWVVAFLLALVELLVQSFD